MQPQSLISFFGSYTSLLTHIMIAVNWNPQVLLKLIFLIMWFHSWIFGLHIYPC